jgi:hypothetical protein
MKTILSISPNDYSRKIAGWQRPLLTVCLSIISVVLATKSVYAINHPPFVSWISDQRVTTAGQFSTQYFRILNYDGDTIIPSVGSTNPSFYDPGNVVVAPCTGPDFTNGCANDGTGYKVTFLVAPTTPGATTITITATDNGSPILMGYTSFTLRLDAAGVTNPPSIGILPNQAIQLPSTTGGTYQTSFVIGDLDSQGNEDYQNFNVCNFTLTSNNHSVLLDNPTGWLTRRTNRQYVITATTVAGAVGAATATVELTEGSNCVLNGNKTSTSFVVQAVSNTNAPPSFGPSSDGSYLVCPVPTPNPTPPLYHYTVVSNDNTSKQDLRVSAFSSNTKLVPNDFVNKLVVTQPDSTGAGTVRITPVLPLPSPSPGVPQSSTITLSVTDDYYTRQSTFLYIVSDATSPAIPFSRSRGVYSFSHGDHRDDNFISGEVVDVNWSAIETALGYDWTALNTVIDNVPTGQQVSLNIQREPCYIAQNTQNTWCDTDPDDDNGLGCTPTTCQGGFLRAVPWDSYLQTRREAFLSALAQDLGMNNRLAKIKIINPNLPGANTGIRNVSADFNGDCGSDPNCMPGYSRAALLGAVQHELRTVQDNFPGKLVQFGFFEATDCDVTCNNNCNPNCTGNQVWKWLYRDASSATDSNGVHLVSLFDEFNGVKRPRVSFFQENLAATRTSVPGANPAVVASNAPNYITPPVTSAYTFTPVLSFLPSFEYYDPVPTNDEYNNGIVFQANAAWSNPLMATGGLKLIKTINGSPNDAMEAAFNAYHSQYLEVYLADIDQAQPTGSNPLTLDAVLWAGELKSWKEYTDALNNLAPIEGPAGLTVTRASATSNTVNWYPVYGATSYTLQRKIFGFNNWTTVSCSDPTATHCLDTGSTGSAYAYRVQATNVTNSLWSYVAVFLSESTYDGYVTHSGLSYNPFNNVSQPGILAGENTFTQLTHERGFVSFNTSLLTLSATILDAKLRLNQATSGANFALLGPCMVDVKQGSFNNNPVLEGLDYSAGATTQNAFSVTNVGVKQWFTAELPLSTAKFNISNTDHTQFRIYFAEGITSGRYEGWYSGESSGNNSQPQLIVQYYSP